jgi:bifunctional DNA-binding transcriptional regulator/antitoxin component of YhaV-PrlF toxin-antitoxin module
MSRITSKFQVSIPRALAEKVGLRIGDELEWEEAAGVLRARAATRPPSDLPASERLRLFDAATVRQRRRERLRRLPRSATRGWSREDLYRR